MDGPLKNFKFFGYKNFKMTFLLLKSYQLIFQDVGFSKEYEEIRADSCLDEYTAQDSQHPDNKDKNRYPNIVACKYLNHFFCTFFQNVFFFNNMPNN